MANFVEIIRPRSLKEIIGNELIKIDLGSWLSAEDKHGTLLFRGGIGYGKSLFGEVTANELGIPIKSFFRQGIPVSRYTVENFRDFVDCFGSRSGFASKQGSWEAFLFDEAHYIPAPAQAMLLAIAERPPQRTAIIFMSSEPDKLDPALRSRCLEFEVTPLTRTETIELLERGCVAAGVRLGDEVLRQIAKVSRGNPRNALIKLGSALNRAEAERKNNILMQQEIRHVQRTY